MKSHFFKNLARKIGETQIWKSIFRHGYEDTPRNRALQILSNVWLHLHPARVPKTGLKITHTFCLGGISFLLFIILTITGVLLMFYYVPEVPRAYYDVKDLEFIVPFGLLLRNIHRWAAHLMVITVSLHMLKVFLTGSYKPPRQFNWVLGVGLLAITYLLSFTGYILPWDQLGYWAINVGAEMAANTPVLGAKGPFSIVTESNDVRFALLGGTKIGPNALLRFYVLHVVALPLIAAALMILHFWRVRKDGGISRPL